MSQTGDPDPEQQRARRWAAVAAERDRLLELVRWRAVSAQDAEDAVQEALLRSVEFEGLDEERIAPFLTTVTMRLCADQHRARVRQQKLDQKVAGRRVEEVGPEEEVCARAEASWVVHALEGMPARQRQVIDARLEGLSDAEIASHLGVSYSSVASALARTRSAVRAMLAAGCSWLVATLRRPRAVAVTAATVAAVGVAITTMRPVVVAPDAATPPIRRIQPVAEVPPARPAPPAVRAKVRTPAAKPPAPPPADSGRIELGDHGFEWHDNDRGTVEQVVYCVTDPAISLPGSGGRLICKE